MRIYNFDTKKIYESDSLFTLTLDEFDANGEQIGQKEFQDTYSAVDDAIDDAYAIMDNIANNDGINADDIDDAENGNTVTFVADGIGSWKFTVIPCEGCETEKEIVDGDDDIDIEEDLEENVNESVAERFARLRRMFESDDESEDEDKDDDDSDKEDDEDKDKDTDSDEDKDEDEEMKAVIITVKKGDEDKCKDEMIDAGISEDDIEILDSEDDDKNVDIRIDVNSVMELKDYLTKKGIDLEEEIGGEIVSDDDEGESDEGGSDEGDEGSDDDFNFDDLGDIFGAGDGEDEE